ncbi:hypothetical protein LTR84_004840 [Exophiala bonariae]|uniref:NB-ARC domain-containing protein n=1 Tax=Exophiala bonariae TaxID=1690606 RepID=A0AAV9NRS5_9EURO|nr:hypothetical protein LTR84_004840 [Exophiala bonariae]
MFDELSSLMSNGTDLPTNLQDDMSITTSTINAGGGSGSDDIPTPFGSEFSADVFLQIWNEAIEGCKRGVDEPEDQKFLTQFNSPGELLEALKMKEQSDNQANSWSSNIWKDLSWTLNVIGNATNIFLIAMKPQSVEMSCFWGFFYLVIMKIAQDSELDHNLRQSLYEVFVALIRFWKEASIYMRNNPPGKLGQDHDPKKVLDYLSNKFERAKKDIDGAVDHLRFCVEMANAKSVSQGEGTLSLATLTLGTIPSTEISFPYTFLPRDNRGRHVGRRQLLNDIDMLLQKDRRVCVWGIGGMGKTSAALAYANETTRFEIVLWVKAESTLALLESFSDIAVDLRLPRAARAQSDKENQIILMEYLASCGRRWLMIFDNVDEADVLRGQLPEKTVSEGTFLMTARTSKVAEDLEEEMEWTLKKILPLNPPHDWELFGQLMQQADRKGWQDLQNVPEDEASAAKLLLEEMGGLPLGIKHISSIMKARKLSAIKFLQLYRDQAGNVETLQQLRGGKNVTFDKDYKFGLHNVWKVAFTELSSTSENWNAYCLLAVICLLAPDGIPSELMLQVRPPELDVRVTTLDFCHSSYGYDLAVSQLADCGLIDQDDELICIHRLTQTAFLSLIPDKDLQDAFNASSEYLYQVFPKQIMGRNLTPSWHICKDYIQHVISLCRRYETLSKNRPLRPCSAFFMLWASCSWYLVEVGENELNIELSNVVQAAYEASAEEQETLTLAALLNGHSISLFETGKVKKALPLMQKCLAIKKKHLPPDDEDLMCTINNLGNFEVSDDRWDSALDHFNAIVGFREAAVGHNKINIAVTYAGLGRVVLGQGNYAEADAYFEKAYKIAVDAFGVLGHCVADFAYARGNVALAQRRWVDAEKHYEEALDVERERKRGTLDLALACLFKLGCLKYEKGDYIAARSLLEQAQAIARERNWLGHLARVSRRLALTIEASSVTPEDLEEAARLHRDSHRDRRRVENDTECANSNDGEEEAFNRNLGV